MTIERFRWDKDQIVLESGNKMGKVNQAVTLANEALTLLFKADDEDAEMGRAPTDLVDQDDLPEVPVEDVDEFAGERDNIGMERADVMEALEAATTVLEEVLDDPQLGGALEEDERVKVQVAVDTLNKRHVMLDVRPAEDIGMSVKAIIRNSEGHVLVLRDAYSEYWDLPGGHIMEHESPEDALRREVREETGLNVTNFTPTVTEVLKLGDETKPVMFFDADAVGNVQLSEEHVGYQWANDDEVLGLNLGVFKNFLLPSPETTGQFGKEEIMEVGTAHVGGQVNMNGLREGALEQLGSYEVVENRENGDVLVRADGELHYVTGEGKVYGYWHPPVKSEEKHLAGNEIEDVKAKPVKQDIYRRDENGFILGKMTVEE